LLGGSGALGHLPRLGALAGLPRRGDAVGPAELALPPLLVGWKCLFIYFKTEKKK
jgi:hypothetical protein